MKLNRTRTVASLQPDVRNGHKPAVVTQFWGNKSVAVRSTESGPGKKPPALPVIKEILPWYHPANLHPIDEVTLKSVKPTVKVTQPKSKSQISLDSLIANFQARRTK